MEQDQRVSRITLPTASFSLEVRHIKWIADEAKKRKTKKSIVIRDLLDHAMATKRDEQEGIAA